MEAKRFNEGKIRHDLIPAYAINEIAKVFTQGAEKYGENNYRKGMPWSKVLASLKRHINSLELGEDFDSESGCYHAAHAATNLIFLLEYYKIAPQFDDRQIKPQWRIGLDIDEVLADWTGAYRRVYNIPDEHVFHSWHLHYDILKRCTEELGPEFYKGLSPLIRPEDIPFEPHCYITSRNIPNEVTMEWLHFYGYPTKPVYTVSLVESKLEIAKRENLDIFVDDVYKNFLELNNGGVFCYLLDRPHNRRFNVGHKRIYNLKDL